MIKVLIADDHKLFRKGLKQTIDSAADMQVAGEATTGNEVLAMLEKGHFDVVMLDLAMPGLSGLEVLKQIKTDNPVQQVLVLSMYPEEQYALRVMKTGAAGYLTKETDEENLIEAIRKVHKGGKYVTPTLAEKMAFAFQVDYEKQPHEMLSDREFQVMQMIARGTSVGNIAKALNIGISTVSTYRSRIIEKTGLKNNAEITHYVIKNDLVE